MLIQENDYNDVLARIQAWEGPVVMDTETNGVDWVRDHVVGMGIRVGEHDHYFPFRHGEGPNLPELKLRQLCVDVLRPDRLQIGLNYGFDIKIAAKDGMQLPRRIRDPQIAAHLMNENEPSFKMERLAAKYLGEMFPNAEDAMVCELTRRFKLRSDKGAKSHLWKLPAADVVRYACQDLKTTLELEEFYAEPLKTWGLADIYTESCSFQLALVQMELRGVGINLETLEKHAARAEPEAARLRRAIFDQFHADLGEIGEGLNANPNSHPQMKLWLKNTCGVPDTKAETLNNVDDFRPKLLLDFRTQSKLMGAFVEPYRRLHVDGRLYPSLHITKAGPGRLSCSDPNLQQVPKGAGFREVFEAKPGHLLVELDFSQAELRVAAHYYRTLFGDEALAKILLRGDDMHQATADEAGIARGPAKTRNFSIQYGAGAKRLAKRYQTSEAHEAAYLAAYNRTFPGVKQLSRHAQRLAEKQKYIRYWTGRCRHYITTPGAAKARPFTASNNLIQGGVAEVLRVAITRIHREVPEARMILTVHDSIMLEQPEHGAREVAERCRAIMQYQPWCTMPMLVDMKIGRNWLDAEEQPRNFAGLPDAVRDEMLAEMATAAAQ